MATKLRLTQLQELQSILDELWRRKRWILNVVTFARDKQTVNGIALDLISQCLANSDLGSDEEPLFQIPTINLSSPTLESPAPSPPPKPSSRRPSRDDSAIDTNYFNEQLKINSSSSSYSFIDSLYFMNSDYKSETYSPKSYEDMRRCVSASKIDGPERVSRMRDHTRGHTQPITTSPSSDQCLVNSKDQKNQGLTVWEPPVPLDLNNGDHEIDPILELPHQSKESEVEPNDSPEQCRGSGLSSSAMARVYIGYDCGLPFGTSVKIQVNAETTVKEIIECVVNHLNSMVESEGESGPPINDPNKFCVIAVFSSEVKHLNDDFRIANLQRPWNRAKICVKFKDNVL